MDANKIEKFIDAGYTKEDIDLLFSDPKIPEEAPKDPEPAPKDPEPAPQDPEPAPKDPDPATNGLTDTVKMLMDTVADLSNTVKALQQSNVTGANTPTPKKDSIAETMQSFIEKL